MQVIALVDPYTGGHHTTFIRQFAKILLDMNLKVIVLHQNMQVDLVPWIQKESNVDNLTCIEYEMGEDSHLSIGFLSNAYTVLKRWMEVKKLLKKVERIEKFKIDVVFFAWLDSFLANYLHPSLLNLAFPYPWIGLYFHPRHLRLLPNMNKKAGTSEIDIALTSSACLGVAIHDRGIDKMFSARLGGKNVIVFPETADGTEPEARNTLSLEIRKNANGRTVVGMIGLMKQQGLLSFIKIAKKSSSDKYFYVFAGRFSSRDMNDAEMLEWEQFLESKPENCFFYLESIPEGAQYNAVFTALDIPYLVYDNFTSSSNRLTKAAIFQKPVIVSDSFLVGEDVRRFHLGVTTDEKNVDSILIDLEKLRTEWGPKEIAKARFRKYAELNSFENLETSFHHLLDDK